MNEVVFGFKLKWYGFYGCLITMIDTISHYGRSSLFADIFPYWVNAILTLLSVTMFGYVAWKFASYKDDPK